MLGDPAARLEKAERTTAAASGRAGQTGAGARLAVWALGSDSLHASAGPDPARPGPIRARGRAANQPVATRNLSWACPSWTGARADTATGAKATCPRQPVSSSPAACARPVRPHGDREIGRA